MGANKDRLVASGVIPANKAGQLTAAEETVIEGMSEDELSKLEELSDKVKKEHLANGGSVDDLEANFIV
jgi:hypothetical protein